MTSLLFLLTLATPALAADPPCFEGPDRLADQQAFWALTAEIDAACPCDAAPSRKRHRRCVKGLVKSAGAVRDTCRKPAKQLYQATACGSRKVLCATVADGDTAATCRVRPARRCRERKGIPYTACPDAARCSDVVDWTAGTCLDPRRPGAFTPGIRTVRLVKDSFTSPGTPRELDTLVWYPATGGTVDAELAGAPAAPLAPGGPYPLVLLSHGTCGAPREYSYLTGLLASHGFVVAAPPHVGNTIDDGIDCLANMPTSAVERPRDVVHVLDHILAADTPDTGFLAGAVDPMRIGMMGHSFGGFTTYNVATGDPRITAAVALAAGGPPPILRVPSLHMLSSRENVVSNDDIRAAYERAAGPKYLVELADTGHLAYSDGCRPPTCGVPGTLTEAEASARVQRIVVPFLRVFLAGDERWRPLLDGPPPPGVTVESAP